MRMGLARLKKNRGKPGMTLSLSCQPQLDFLLECALLTHASSCSPFYLETPTAVCNGTFACVIDSGLLPLLSFHFGGRHSSSLYPSTRAGPGGCSVHICCVNQDQEGCLSCGSKRGFYGLNYSPSAPQVLTSRTSEVMKLR